MVYLLMDDGRVRSQTNPAYCPLGPQLYRLLHHCHNQLNLPRNMKSINQSINLLINQYNVHSLLLEIFSF